MYEAVINKSELEIRRSLYETKKFIDKVLAGVKESCIELDQYILSEGIYKKFIEEYIPIFKYLEHKYGLDSRILFGYVGIGNQGYDAEIKVDNQVNNISKKIEIAYLLLGKESKERSREIVKEGSSFRIYQPEEKLYEIKDLVIKVAKNKALKLYSDTLLLLYLP